MDGLRSPASTTAETTQMGRFPSSPTGGPILAHLPMQGRPHSWVLSRSSGQQVGGQPRKGRAELGSSLRKAAR
jgi:hypothetical protein